MQAIDELIHIVVFNLEGDGTSSPCYKRESLTSIKRWNRCSSVIKGICSQGKKMEPMTKLMKENL